MHIVLITPPIMCDLRSHVERQNSKLFTNAKGETNANARTRTQDLANNLSFYTTKYLLILFIYVSNLIVMSIFSRLFKTFYI